MSEPRIKNRLVNVIMPFSLTAFILIADQISKALIVSSIKPHRIGWTLFGGFLRIVHTRNLGNAFGIGADLPEVLRVAFSLVLPVLLLAVLIWYYCTTTELTAPQRWAIAGIFGGGLGNLIDRIFRPAGVVDFMDVRVFGLFGWEYWPTFNVADASVVVSCLFLLVTFLLKGKKSE